MTHIKYHRERHPLTNKRGYVLDETFTRYSKRYKRSKTCYSGMWSNGANSFVDLGSNGIVSRLFAWCRNRLHDMTGNEKSGWFFVHDGFCNDGLWDVTVEYDCTSELGHNWLIYDNEGVFICSRCRAVEYVEDHKISNWEASTVAANMLWEAGYRFWSVPVWHATWLFGGGEARKNGMYRVRTKSNRLPKEEIKPKRHTETPPL